MADRITPDHRSWNMSRIRGKDTKPELLVRRWLYSGGFRYRLHARLPGRPDIVLPKYNTVVFVHGCFWHCHGCSNSTLPKTNPDFWRQKLEGNAERDLKNATKLQDLGWNVITVWECRIKEDFESIMTTLADDIRSK